ncbi:MAG: 4Fe-4S ferredoxin [Chloroflexi bacterium AL-N10]|nr:4Fe-4S ferredoxin [Chloroflexi bacterium AL-N1]NOK66701.1 4Fe-4S ferredoxin [Chloroflexi bacterium AL-N10]NOK72089.1 4Fe-4S ferredoxin [Chloroflexi bacterium AL-N5]
MASMKQHPTVVRFYERTELQAPSDHKQSFDANRLRQMCLDAGAEDVGFVSINRPEVVDQRDDILLALPATKTLISFVCRMNREPVRSPLRSIANAEFHSAGDRVDDVGNALVTQLERQGVRALYPTVGFPMEVQHFPGKTWVISHKPIAVAAGLGQMGIHRNVIHPKFGNFILLGTILVDAEVEVEHHPIDYNPCLECKLCVAACPVGAISPEGDFNFTACFTHNYREFMGGFNDWVTTVVESKSAQEYREKFTDGETASMWQSLSFKANYKAAYCMAVCPAGEDVIAPFLTNRPNYLQDVVKPLQNKVETLYVIPGSDAEAYAQRRFPHKHVKQVGSGIRVNSIHSFLSNLSLAFQPNKAKDLNATYHFTFTGAEERNATITIQNQTVTVSEGHQGTADLQIQADSQTWVGFLQKERNLLWAIIRRKIRVKGPLKLMAAFGRVFATG